MSGAGFSYRASAPRVLTIILAGGEGTRLMPLTRERAKPAVPMGGRYRLVDFVLSNFVNSEFLKIKVLTQYKSDSLITHLTRGWRLSQTLDFFVEIVPAQMRTGRTWFRGSADALFQSLNVVTDEHPDYVCVFSADHMYKMDIRQMLDSHIRSGADMTVLAATVPREQAGALGVLTIDSSGRMTSFAEKVPDPPGLPGRPGWCLCSMGNYIWNTKALIAELKRDALSVGDSQHDFGRNILPSLVGRVPVAVYEFEKNSVPGEDERARGYWREIGTVAAYYAANMDLVQVNPVFNLHNQRWPIRTWSRPFPPAKFVFADKQTERMGLATDSLVSEGCIISGGRVNRSILSPNVRINSYSYVEKSILFEGVSVGRRALVRRAIVDKNVQIPEGCRIGYDHDEDRARGLSVIRESGIEGMEGMDGTEGIVVVPKAHKF
ncbi:MAG: glucose-1-phosphate adenylyltransferase [Pseudomonadota bacterium]